jgi:hypothetical protein
LIIFFSFHPDVCYHVNTAWKCSWTAYRCVSVKPFSKLYVMMNWVYSYLRRNLWLNLWHNAKMERKWKKCKYGWFVYLMTDSRYLEMFRNWYHFPPNAAISCNHGVMAKYLCPSHLYVSP